MKENENEWLVLAAIGKHMKQKWRYNMKRKSIMIWGMACTFASALMGCGGNADTATESSGEGEAEDFVYVAEYEELGEEGYGVGSVIIGEDGTVFYTIANEDETRLAVRKTDGGGGANPGRSGGKYCY